MSNSRRVGRSVLVESQVAVIKHKLYLGASPRILAEEYDVGVETIRRIGRGETWSWVEPKEEVAALSSVEEAQSLETLQKMLGDVQKIRDTNEELKKLKET